MLIHRSPESESLSFDRKAPSNIVQEYCYEIAVRMFHLVGGFMRIELDLLMRDSAGMLLGIDATVGT